MGKAYVFCRTKGAPVPVIGIPLGHVGGAFELPDGNFRCFGTENPKGDPYVPAAEKGFWNEDCTASDVVSTFSKSRVLMGIACPPYDVYKILEQSNPNYDAAINKLAWCGLQDYQLLSAAIVKSRTCEDDVCDTLSAYGLWMPWTITYPKPNDWFGVIASQQFSV